MGERENFGDSKGRKGGKVNEEIAKEKKEKGNEVETKMRDVTKTGM